MRITFSTTVVALLSLAANAPAAEPQPPQGFTALFNGRDLAGWHGWKIHDKGAGPMDLEKLTPEDRAKRIAEWTADAGKHWRAEDSELVNDGSGAYLATDKSFGDIELLIEYKTVPKADSGIYLRATPQVQIWDTTKDGGKWNLGADKGSGGLFNNAKDAPGQAPLAHADRPFGEWNRFRIIQVGERTTVWLNGKLVVDHARLENYWGKQAKLDPLPALPKTGPLLLQTHGGEIRWRNLFVREIGPAEATALLRQHGAAGFQDVFNGKDFTSWAGTLDNYEVADGAIVCKPKKGGNIFTKDEYTDFVVRLEYQVPPGGNNGLAIRYPGKGQASLDAMCEIQILDDDAPRYAKLDPRQFNGSAYGMMAAQRGYGRPAGEWNFMEVLVRGHVLQVELNGTRILDGDLSKVTEFKDKKDHPGRLRTAGHFGFCGHNDPVAFRNIQIKRLEAK